MIRREQAEAIPGEPNGEQAEPGPDDLAAAAADAHRGAREESVRADLLRDQADKVVAAADREAERITSEARTKALAIIADATAADREAARLSEQAQYLEHAAAEETAAAEADQLVSDLEDERERLGVTIADIDATLDDLSAQRADLDGQLAAARESADLDSAVDLEARISGIDGITATQASQRAAAQARDAAAEGEAERASATASNHHAAVRATLNKLYRGRPEAVMDAALAELKGALEGNLARIAEERNQQNQPVRQMVARN